MLEFVFLLIALAAVAAVYWDGMRREPAGAPRWLWLASVVALGTALACNTVDMSTVARVVMWLLVIALIVAAGRARERAGVRG